jgi:hypothetical protein
MKMTVKEELTGILVSILIGVLAGTVMYWIF